MYFTDQPARPTRRLIVLVVFELIARPRCAHSLAVPTVTAAVERCLVLALLGVLLPAGLATAVVFLRSSAAAAAASSAPRDCAPESPPAERDRRLRALAARPGRPARKSTVRTGANRRALRARAEPLPRSTASRTRSREAAPSRDLSARSRRRCCRQS